jgi:transcriptional regulator with XRE-family HTH domain
MSDFKRRLAREFNESAEYRESYAESFANEYITAQIKLNRKGRKISQSELGEMIESNQGRISIYEDKEYGRWNIETLRKIANRLGCWLKISIESYSTLLDEAERFSAAGLARHSFESDPEIERWLSDRPDEETDPFSPARRLIGGWLRKDTDDLQPLCDWLQGVGLPNFSEGEEEFQWILWALKPSRDWPALKAELASRIARLITGNEIDIRPVGFRPEPLLRNLFMLAANLEEPAALQAPLDQVFQRQSKRKKEQGTSLLGRQTLSALRTAMERNQHDESWKDLWFEFVTEGRHSLLPGSTQAGIDGLLHLNPEMERPGYWGLLAGAIRELLVRRYTQDRVAPGRTPDVLDEMTDLIASIFTFWGDARSAIHLLQAALSNRWMQESVASWSAAVFDQKWEEAIRLSPAPLEKRAVAAALYDGATYWREWHDKVPQRGQSDQPAEEVVNLIAEDIRVQRPAA